MPQIEARSLSKQFRIPVRQPGLVGAFRHLFTQEYRQKIAVDQISLTIEAGEAVAYVGPNGAGKSTTIKMMTGILVPSAGEIQVDGRVPFREREANAHQIGAVFGQRTQLWWDLPVRESFALLRDIYGLPEPLYRQRLAYYTELLGMAEFLDLSVRKISLGQRMRADLAAALLHQPKILFLDEPTIGLDLAVKARIREAIRTLNSEQGTTIVLTTHDLGDIEDICRRLVIIDQGRIIYDGTLEQIKQRFARQRIVHIQLRHPAEQLAAKLGHLPVTIEQSQPLDLAIQFDPQQIGAGELLTMLLAHADIADFRIEEPGVEQVIRQVYEGTLQLD